METKYLLEDPLCKVGADKPTRQDNGGINRPRDALTEKDLVFLQDTVGTLFELTLKRDIYEFLAVSLNRFLNGAIVLVNSFDETSDSLRVCALAGIGTHIDRIVSALGNHPLHISVQMNDEARKGLTSGTLKKVAGGVHELATGTIPEIVCSAIEDILKVSGAYAMGITCRDRIMGSVAILVKEEIRNPVIVETFVGFAAVALQRRGLTDIEGDQKTPSVH